MGRVQIQRGETDWAREALATAADAVSQDKIADVLAAYDDMLDAQPSQPWLHAEHAAALERAGRTSEATTAHERAITLDPDNPSLHFNKGELLFSLSRLDEAQTEFLTVTRLQPNDVLGAAVLLAAIAWPASTKQAREHLRNALSSPGEQLRPFSRALYHAIALAGLHRPEEAITELEAAATSRPEGELQLNNAHKAVLERFRQPPLPSLDMLLRLLESPQPKPCAD